MSFLRHHLFVAMVVTFGLVTATMAKAQTLPWSVQTQSGSPALVAYNLQPLDKINVRVFGQDQLSVDKLEIDAGGQIILPLIGVVQAAGKTAQELSEEIATRYEARYLQSPQVSVLLAEAIGQRVTVSGAVVEAGVYTIKGPATLLQVLSMAKGPDPKLADLRQVAVFRVKDGARARAIFDVEAIAKGAAEDPLVIGGDTIMVANSRTKGVWRELIGILPSLGVFAWF